MGHHQGGTYFEVWDPIGQVVLKVGRRQDATARDRVKLIHFIP